MADRRGVLVTGATGLLGRALVTTFAGHGWAVAAHYRSDEAGAEELVRQVRADGGVAVALSAELAQDDVDARAEALLAAAEREVGPLRAVVLCASTQEVTSWDDLDATTWDRVYRDSLRHTAALLHAAGRRLPEQGAAVVIGSIEGLRPAHRHTAYAVMKAATHHLVAAAAYQLGPRSVRVVGVAPGLIDRPGLAQDWPQGLQRWRETAALHRPVTAREVAAVAAFCASPAASGLTGVVIPVDAGWSASPGW